MKRGALAALALVAAIALPFVAHAAGLDYYVGFVTRLLIFGMAATALNWLIGHGGLVCFGQAAFLGIGAYTAGILSAEAATWGTRQALLAWPAAALMAGAAGALVAAISLRTRGVYFIMSTLALAQMFYYVAVSLKTYGGDDGLTLVARATLPGVPLASTYGFYAVALALCVGTVMLFAHLADTRFGWLYRAARINEAKAETLGADVFRVRFAAFVIAAAVTGLAGALLADLSLFVSPKLMDWTQSGTLMVMVIIGGLGRPLGGLIGAAVLLGLEEALTAHTEHWQLLLGVIVLVIVFAAPKGLAGLVDRFAAR